MSVVQLPRLRHGIASPDRERVAAMVKATRFFSESESLIAVELVDEALAKGEAGSGYHFIFAGEDGYACYGPIPGTESSFDLYWIVVDPAKQGMGLGRLLARAVDEAVRKAGGTRLYVDTSSRRQYEPTRAFYRRMGFSQAALLEDFYAPGDGKVIFEKRLTPPSSAA